MKEDIPYTRPSITRLEREKVADAMLNGWGKSCYDYISLFEKKFRDYVQTEYSIATSSCTGALHLGLAAMGIGPGDEVILADTNWIATAVPIVHLGATPVFVDILQDTWCLDPVKVEAAINPRTRAIIAVHLYGNLCEMNQLIAISEKYGIPIIEDAAEAIGSIYFGRHAGSIGKFGVYSFHGTKTITTGEGGMFVTNDQGLYDRVLTLSNHGRDRNQAKQFWPDAVGYKYKMSNIQAAMGCGQLERIDELVGRKREIMEYYRSFISTIPGLTTNPEYDGTINGAWMPTAVFANGHGVSREMIVSAFRQENIDARVFFWPLSGLPMFPTRTKNSNSESIAARAINLPSFHDITLDQQDRICHVLYQLSHL